MAMTEFEQRTADWLAVRAGKITASLAAGCLGLDPHKGPITCWKEIMGYSTTAMNTHMRWGVEREGDARECYEVVSGNLVNLCGFCIHDDLPWLGASPDGTIGSDGLLEAKCPGSLPTFVPIHHRIQCLVQLACTGRKWVDYFAWTPHAYFLCRVFTAGIAGLTRRLNDWRLKYIVTNEAPPRRKAKRRLKIAKDKPEEHDFTEYGETTGVSTDY